MSEKNALTLLALLDEERGALLRGDYADLDRLAPAKQVLLTRLPGSAAGEDIMRRVAHTIRRNQSLLAAAIDGMRAAKTKMVDLRDRRSSFTVYDKSGLRQTVSDARPVVEHKA